MKKGENGVGVKQNVFCFTPARYSSLIPIEWPAKIPRMKLESFVIRGRGAEILFSGSYSMLFQPIAQSIVDPCLPTPSGGFEAAQHIRRQADTNRLFGVV